MYSLVCSLREAAGAESPRRTGKFNFPATIGLTAPAGGGSDLGALFSGLNISLKECLQGGGWIIFSAHFDRAGIIQAAAAAVSCAALEGLLLPSWLT